MRKKYNIIKKNKLPNNAEVVGITKLKAVKEDENKEFRIVENTKVDFYKSKSKKGILKGYVKLDESQNKYLEVRKLYPLIILLLMCILLVMLAIVLCNRTNDESHKTPLPSDPNQGEYVEPSHDIIHSQNIILPGWGTITIDADKTYIDSGVDFYNPKGNLWYKCPDCNDELKEKDEMLYCKHCDKEVSKEQAIEDCYYMSFALYLGNPKDGIDNSELLYKSDLVSPNMHIQHITLNRPLSKNNYDAFIVIQPYKSDMASECNRGIVNLDKGLIVN